MTWWAGLKGLGGRGLRLTLPPPAPGALVFADGGGGHEGLFHRNQLLRKESAQTAVQRAQAAAAKARALVM